MLPALLCRLVVLLMVVSRGVVVDVFGNLAYDIPYYGVVTHGATVLTPGGTSRLSPLTGSTVKVTLQATLGLNQQSMNGIYALELDDGNNHIIDTGPIVYYRYLDRVDFIFLAVVQAECRQVLHPGSYAAWAQSCPPCYVNPCLAACPPGAQPYYVSYAQYNSGSNIDITTYCSSGAAGGTYTYYVVDRSNQEQFALPLNHAQEYGQIPPLVSTAFTNLHVFPLPTPLPPPPAPTAPPTAPPTP